MTATTQGWEMLLLVGGRVGESTRGSQVKGFRGQAGSTEGAAQSEVGLQATGHSHAGNRGHN